MYMNLDYITREIHYVKKVRFERQKSDGTCTYPLFLFLFLFITFEPFVFLNTHLNFRFYIALLLYIIELNRWVYPIS